MATNNLIQLGKAIGQIEYWNKQIAKAKGINGLDFNNRSQLAEALVSVAALLNGVAAANPENSSQAEAPGWAQGTGK